jgi:hypothetical protein
MKLALKLTFDGLLQLEMNILLFFFNVISFEWEFAIMINLPIDSRNAREIQNTHFCIAQHVARKLL